jgi:hypothetical protein
MASRVETRLRDDETLVDCIYEAAVVPELWPGVLLRLSELIEGVGATLFAWDGRTAKWRATPGPADGCYDRF